MTTPVLDRVARHVIAEHYPTTSQRRYVRGKLAGDPVYAAVAKLFAEAAKLPLLDIGCGMGLLGQYLHASGNLHGYLGIDHDERKIDAARLAYASLDTLPQWHCSDATELPDQRGHVALLDMLHYMPATTQEHVLRLAAQRVAPGGYLIIRNVLRERNWRYHITRAEEFFLQTSGWMRVGAQHYPTREEIRQPLEMAGLELSIAPLRGFTPFNSYLIVGCHPT